MGRAGEGAGVAGIRDSGLETLELAIAGLLPFQGGTVELQGKPLMPGDPYRFRELGGVYVSADRLGTAMAPRLSLWDSIVVHAHRRALRGVGGRFGLLDRLYLDQWVSMVLEHAEISAAPQQTAESCLVPGFFPRDRDKPCRSSLLVYYPYSHLIGYYRGKGFGRSISRKSYHVQSDRAHTRQRLELFE